MNGESSLESGAESLAETLAALEGAVATPFVPGELESWIGSVEDAFQRLKPLLPELFDSHQAQFQEIRNEDPGLHQRVDQMRETDREIGAAADELQRRIPTLQQIVTNLEPDEAQLMSTMNSFVDECFAFIIAIRKQERAVRTWLLEALNRDRGDVD